MLALVQRVAQVDVTALLSGPSGVGKEVVAQILHNASARATGPFIALNCSAMPEHLVESILFGHIKGSFTGAVKDQPGIFEEAHQGTLFLDEVGELPLHIQPKLLRVIQERKAARIGSTRETGFDVRLVAATNRDLVELVKRGEFREDLLYRLNAFHIGIPPLRERPEDIRQLAITLAASEQIAGISMQIEESAIQELLRISGPAMSESWITSSAEPKCWLSTTSFSPSIFISMPWIFLQIPSLTIRYTVLSPIPLSQCINTR